METLHKGQLALSKIDKMDKSKGKSSKNSSSSSSSSKRNKNSNLGEEQLTTIGERVNGVILLLLVM